MTQPTVCLALMVKNEESILSDCLRSIPPDLYDYFVICDTGSTDKTQQVARDTLIGLGHIVGEYLSHDWESFGANKTRMLRAAAASGRDWILMMDADHKFQTTNTVERIKELIQQHTSADQLMIRFPGPVEYRLPQLIRNNRAWKYVGVTHEYLDSEVPAPIIRENFDGFTIIDCANGANREKKFERDLELLREGLKQEPGNPRYLYYLAQTWRDLGHHMEAHNLYQQRSQLGGFEEERWHALYQAARMWELGNPGDEFTSIVEYLEAYAQRTQRLEPLVHAIRLCRQQQLYHLGWMLGRSIIVGKPWEDVLFIEPSAYDWEFDFEWGICAYYVGEKEEFQQAMGIVINCPTAPDGFREQAQKNLTFLS